MKEFAQLYRTIDQTTKTIPKVNALAHYFTHACDDDKLWTIALFSHRDWTKLRNIMAAFADMA